jgi:hypothetical protein
MTYENRPPGGDETSLAGDRAREAAATGREQVQEVASTATDQARSVASTAGSEVREVASTATDQARRLAADARVELRNQAAGQVDRLAEGLDDLTRQLRSMGERGDPGPATDLARQAADRTAQLTGRLREGGLDDAAAQLRSTGRNRPGLFLLGAFGAGLLAGRVARNLVQDPTEGSAGDRGDGGNGSAATRQPATVREAGIAAGQGTPLPAAMPTVAPDTTGAVPGTTGADAGHAAYGAPVGDQTGKR